MNSTPDDDADLLEDESPKAPANHAGYFQDSEKDLEEELSTDIEGGGGALKSTPGYVPGRYLFRAIRCASPRCSSLARAVLAGALPPRPASGLSRYRRYYGTPYPQRDSAALQCPPLSPQRPSAEYGPGHLSHRAFSRGKQAFRMVSFSPFQPDQVLKIITNIYLTGY